MATTVHRLRLTNFEVFIAQGDEPDVEYFYGGTRCVDPDTSDAEILAELERLRRDESGVKNALINLALEGGALADLDPERFPDGFLTSRVGGGRCLIRPANEAIAAAISDPSNPGFARTLTPVFAAIGRYLNERRGRIKLTPDFGRFAGLADLLARHTEHSLGIACEDGGCGGKASYTTTGVVAAFETLGRSDVPDAPLTLIGSNGAMGVEFLEYAQPAMTDLRVCDLAYDRDVDAVEPPAGVVHEPSDFGRFTDACLTRGGTIVATTVGQELEHSSWELLPEGTMLLLAHNLAIPEGQAGDRLMEAIDDRGVVAYPGQILTLGGALASRLEWFWRQSRPGVYFDKPLAHEVVRAVVTYLVARVEARRRIHGLTPFAAMKSLVGEAAAQ